MTDIIASTLHDLRFTTGTRLVVDELAAFETLLPDGSDNLERHAALFERLPSLLTLRGRALQHSRQYERFLALAEADASALDHRIDTANALAVLAHAGEIAMLLVPTISPEDRFARTLLSRERSLQYADGGGVHAAELMMRALRRSGSSKNMGLTRDGRVPPELTEAARRFRGGFCGEAVEGDARVPGAYLLEDAPALEAWFNNSPDLIALLDEAKARLGSVDAWSEQDDISPHWYGAVRGALVLAYAELCRIGLWPARTQDDLVAKMEVDCLICERAVDPDHMRALVEIALGVGRRIARQGPPFVTRLSGVEL
ncbi:hypothetical protein AB6806_18655 [Bosea sp. RCC_152_1]|uniref:hypothetical protein n=1 Tax=Bosea sp. RCC_152_1 TaxID=3239228 RepID=UPI003524DD08